MFFNGGPGTATSQLLFAYNTGPKTLDPTRTGGQPVASNTIADWSEFANLLYIDAPGTGFSYMLKNSDGSTPLLGTDMDRDAAIFVQVVTRFLTSHRSLVDNDVIVVGESYGGARSVLMFDHLLHYADLANAGSAFRDAQLYGDLMFYFGMAFGTQTPTVQDIVARWGHQVLIQPVVGGEEQQNNGDGRFPYAPDDCLAPACWMLDPDDDPETACDAYNCDRLRNWADADGDTIETQLTTVASLEAMLGVDPRTIAWMAADARSSAYGRGTGPASGETPDMEAEFGVLGAEDSYYVRGNGDMLRAYPGARRWSDSGAGMLSATQFVGSLYLGVQTFITVARYDSVVPTVGIPYVIAGFSGTEPMASWIDTVWYDPADPFYGFARPGTMGLGYQPDSSYAVSVAMPHYYESGHTVVMRAPAELRGDVMKWYSDSLD